MLFHLTRGTFIGHGHFAQTVWLFKSGFATIEDAVMTTFRVVNFGCRASQADGAALKRQMLEAGLEEAPRPELSSVVVLNTCTVTARADAEVRQVIRRIHRLNPDCRIVVTGCYAQRAPQELAHLEGVRWIIGNSHKHQLIDVIQAQFSTEACQSRPYGQAADITSLVQIRDTRPIFNAQVLVGEIADEFHFSPIFPDDRTRPTLKVQDGCNARCSFCIIPDVRGPGRSLAPEKVVEQVRELENSGYKEIVLSGINLGSYGKDLDRRIRFLDLLEKILRETSIPRLRISSIEPMDVSPELVRLVAGEGRLARHFHIPLQSGSDRILRLMNRRYWTSQYTERALAIHEQIPNCGFGADVMVGFPGETAQDHAASVRFIESLPFTYLHIFPYSARPGTPAAQMPNAVDPHAVRARSQEVRSLIAEKRQTFLAAQLGQQLSVLTLDEMENGARIGLSSNFLKVALPGSSILSNTLLNVCAERVTDGIIFGNSVASRDD